ncbi:MAG: DUF2892 domain-containing protein [Deltaproteobacteria bacterium]|nr:DUF2892 domain-containing protein [Deltaproteobacteria bacterium]
MQCNVGKKDRIFRIMAGLLVLGIGLAYGSLWGLVGLVPIFTAIIGYCPLYKILGMTTCPKGDRNSTLPDTSSEEANKKSLK